MSIQKLYPLTSAMTVIGVFAIVYGIQSTSALLLLEGTFLLWLSISITVSVWEVQASGEL